MRSPWVLVAASALLAVPAAAAGPADGLAAGPLKLAIASDAVDYAVVGSGDEPCGMPAGADQGRLWVCSNGSKQYLSCFVVGEVIECPHVTVRAVDAA